MAKTVMFNFRPMALAVLFLGSFALADLSTSYYASSCSNISNIVKSVVYDAINSEARMGASLLRLHFHDCFVQGCDASILLDDGGEKSAGPNENSLRGYDVIDDIKTAVEAQCPGVVSCADILALAARDAVVKLGGPTWSVPLGRRDSTTASQSLANSDLPKPTENVSQILAKFDAKGLSKTDMVALSGSHTIGQARCTNFRDRLYDFNGTGKADPSLDSDYLSTLKNSCPSSGGDDNLSSLDYRTSTGFDKKYYSNLVSGKGLLNSDQELYYTPSAKTLASSYALSQSLFFSNFASAMVKMGNISPLTRSSGEIRSNCQSVNS